MGLRLGRQVLRHALFAFALALALPGGGRSAIASEPAAKKPVCAVASDDDTPQATVQKRFLIEGACTDFSSEVNVVGQNLLQSSASLPALITRRGLGPSATPFVLTVNATLRAETLRQTPLGGLSTVVELKAERDSGGDAGIVNLSEGTVALRGWTAGFTDSLMNFWDGDFQFSANAPSRNVGIVSFEASVTDDVKIAVANETGVPSSTGTDVRFIPVTFADPVASIRARYDKDDLTIHASAMVHELKRGGDNPVLALVGQTGSATTPGWAASLGVTLPVKAIHEDDTFTLQGTYAANASSYLGTRADLATLSALAPAAAQTRGWSAIASYHHVWSEQFESNVFASRLQLDVPLPNGAPRADVERYAANLIWKPVDGFKTGIEVGQVDVKLAPNGILGVLNGASGRALVGYVFATWNF
jgi:hypothetical protein